MHKTFNTLQYFVANKAIIQKIDKFSTKSLLIKMKPIVICIKSFEGKCSQAAMFVKSLKVFKVSPRVSLFILRRRKKSPQLQGQQARQSVIVNFKLLESRK